MQAPAELRTIRALSQYRPFEGGGESVRDAHADLALAALAEAGGSCTGSTPLKEAIHTLFRIDLSELSLAAALKQLIGEERVRTEGGSFVLEEIEAARLEAVAAESEAVAAEALAEWRQSLVDRWLLNDERLDRLTGDLAIFLRTVMQRHGAEATLLLYPDAERCLQLYADIEAEGFDFLPATDIPEIRDAALAAFIRNPTEAQRAYVAQNLNAAYFLTVLSIDPDGARLVTEITRGQRVYLDTNFLYRLLGVQGPRFVKPDELILKSTQAAGYQVAVTPWTLDEFRGSLRRSQEFLAKYPIPPSQYADLAADAASGDNFVTAYWRQVRTGIKPQDFFEYYTEIETHLSDRGIDVVTNGCQAVDAQTDAITDQMSILAKVSYGYRHPAILEHDVKHRMLVQRLRGEGRRTFSNAGFWFLTHHSILPRYDYHAAETSGQLSFCVTAGAWFQVTEAFRSKTDDPEQSLTDMLASPYVRFRRTLSQRNALEIVGRVDKYKDGSPELATRVLMNSAAVEQIESSVNDEERTAKIDAAIVTAARDAQEEARQVRETADEDRRRANEATKAAQERAAQAERRAAEAIAAADAARRIEVAGAEQRKDQAIRDEQARAADRLAAEEARHRSELAKERSRATTARRRLRFFIALVVSVFAFFLLDLAVGLKSAWAAVVAASVLAGLWLTLAVWARRHSEGDD
jgi:hypothetical protein